MFVPLVNPLYSLLVNICIWYNYYVTKGEYKNIGKGKDIDRDKKRT